MAAVPLPVDDMNPLNKLLAHRIDFWGFAVSEVVPIERNQRDKLANPQKRLSVHSNRLFCGWLTETAALANVRL